MAFALDRTRASDPVQIRQRRIFLCDSDHVEVLERHGGTDKPKTWDTAGKWTYGSGKIERTGAWWLETTATVEEVDSSISK